MNGLLGHSRRHPSRTHFKKIGYKPTGWLAEIEYCAKSAERKLRHRFSRAFEKMNWGHAVRNFAVAIGITFVTAVGVYLAIRFLQSVL
jgi:hypothetical protein